MLISVILMSFCANSTVMVPLCIALMTSACRSSKRPTATMCPYSSLPFQGSFLEISCIMQYKVCVLLEKNISIFEVEMGKLWAIKNPYLQTPGVSTDGKPPLFVAMLHLGEKMLDFNAISKGICIIMNCI